MKDSCRLKTALTNSQFLSHPQPLMFVAGLTPSRDRAASKAAPEQRDRSASASHLEASHGAPALTTPITSPERHDAALPTSPPAGTPTKVNSSNSLDQIAGPSSGSSQEDEFGTLTRNLREALEGMGGKGKVWLNQRERRDFRIMLVDKVSKDFFLTDSSASVYPCEKSTRALPALKASLQPLTPHYPP